jgi:hypothetical protein
LEYVISPASGLDHDRTATVPSTTDESTGLGHGVDGITARLFARSEKVLIKVDEDNDAAAPYVTENCLGTDDHPRI